MKISIEAQSDVGRVRELNEDSFRVVPEKNTVIVCDGMGGHAAGEIASATAAETIADIMRNQFEDVAASIFPMLERPMPKEAVLLAGAVRLANRRVFNTASKSRGLKGMGTTVVAAVFTDGFVATAHVGDSRAYRINNGEIEPLTIDHSWIAELVASGQVKPEDADNFADKNVITRALGTRPNVQVDIGVHPTKAGEVYLLCSDGVCGYVSDDDMLKIVVQYQDDLSAAAAGLIAAANAAGGLDNSTVALVRVEEEGKPTEDFPNGTVTLGEETDEELESFDSIISERYPETEASPKAKTGTRKVQTAPEPVRQRPPAEVEAVPESRGGVRWGWIIGLVVIISVAAAYFWPKKAAIPPEPDMSTEEPAQSGTVATTPDETERPPLVVPPAETTAAEEPAAEAITTPDQTGLIYLVAFGEDRNAGVYWDGQYRGRVAELELGMNASPGDHRLVVLLKSGDTLMNSSVTVLPKDTLDIEVR